LGVIRGVGEGRGGERGEERLVKNTQRLRQEIAVMRNYNGGLPHTEPPTFDVNDVRVAAIGNQGLIPKCH
jgi:hypothetical protein